MSDPDEGLRDPEVALVADPDPTRAGRAVRERLDAGARVAGYVGDRDDPACAEFAADVVRSRPRRPSA